MNQVFTTKGLVDRNRLTAVDAVEEGDNYRKIITLWLLDGEVVRQDASVSQLRALETTATQGTFA